jgi:hypothetical protein
LGTKGQHFTFRPPKLLKINSFKSLWFGIYEK